MKVEEICLFYFAIVAFSLLVPSAVITLELCKDTITFSKLSSCLVLHLKMQVWDFILFDNAKKTDEDLHVRNEKLRSLGTHLL